MKGIQRYSVLVQSVYMKDSPLAILPKTYKKSELVTNSPGGGVLSYLCYIGICDPKGYGFSAVLVINRISIFHGFGFF